MLFDFNEINHTPKPAPLLLINTLLISCRTSAKIATAFIWNLVGNDGIFGGN